MAADKKSKAAVPGVDVPAQALAIDADSMLLNLIEGYLRKSGTPSIYYSSDGHEGIRYLRSMPFDLIILDIKLKNPNGHDIYNAIRATPGMMKVPIILISGQVTRDDVLIAQKDRSTRFLIKPFTEEILMDLVKATYAKAAKAGDILIKPQVQNAAQEGEVDPYANLRGTGTDDQGDGAMIIGGMQAVGDGMQIARGSGGPGTDLNVMQNNGMLGGGMQMVDGAPGQGGDPTLMQGKPPTIDEMNARLDQALSMFEANLPDPETQPKEPNIPAPPFSFSKKRPLMRTENKKNPPPKPPPSEFGSLDEALKTFEATQPPAGGPTAPTGDGGLGFDVPDFGQPVQPGGAPGQAPGSGLGFEMPDFNQPGQPGQPGDAPTQPPGSGLGFEMPDFNQPVQPPQQGADPNAAPPPSDFGNLGFEMPDFNQPAQPPQQGADPNAAPPPSDFGNLGFEMPDFNQPAQPPQQGGDPGAAPPPPSDFGNLGFEMPDFNQPVQPPQQGADPNAAPPPSDFGNLGFEMPNDVDSGPQSFASDAQPGAGGPTAFAGEAAPGSNDPFVAQGQGQLGSNPYLDQGQGQQGGNPYLDQGDARAQQGGNPYLDKGQAQPGSDPFHDQKQGQLGGSNPYLDQGQGQQGSNPYLDKGQAQPGSDPFHDQKQGQLGGSNPYLDQGQGQPGSDPFHDQKQGQLGGSNPYLDQGQGQQGGNPYLDQGQGQQGGNPYLDQGQQAAPGFEMPQEPTQAGGAPFNQEFNPPPQSDFDPFASAISRMEDQMSQPQEPDTSSKGLPAEMASDPQLGGLAAAHRHLDESSQPDNHSTAETSALDRAMQVATSFDSGDFAPPPQDQEYSQPRQDDPAQQMQPQAPDYDFQMPDFNPPNLPDGQQPPQQPPQQPDYDFQVPDFNPPDLPDAQQPQQQANDDFQMPDFNPPNLPDGQQPPQQPPQQPDYDFQVPDFNPPDLPDAQQPQQQANDDFQMPDFNPPNLPDGQQPPQQPPQQPDYDFQVPDFNPPDLPQPNQPDAYQQQSPSFEMPATMPEPNFVPPEQNQGQAAFEPPPQGAPAQPDYDFQMPDFNAPNFAPPGQQEAPMQQQQQQQQQIPDFSPPTQPQSTQFNDPFQAPADSPPAFETPEFTPPQQSSDPMQPQQAPTPSSDASEQGPPQSDHDFESPSSASSFQPPDQSPGFGSTLEQPQPAEDSPSPFQQPSQGFPADTRDQSPDLDLEQAPQDTRGPQIAESLDPEDDILDDEQPPADQPPMSDYADPPDMDLDLDLDPGLDHEESPPKRTAPTPIATPNVRPNKAKSKFLTNTKVFDKQIDVPIPANTLVVDPDADSVTRIKECLSALNFEDVQICRDGQDAWKTLEDSPPDLLIMDWKLPSINGLALYHKIRSREQIKHLPVIVTSSHVAREDFRIINEDSHTHFIEKPIAQTLFQQAIKELCANAYTYDEIDKLISERFDPIEGNTGAVLHSLKVSMHNVPEKVDFAARVGDYFYEKDNIPLAEKIYRIVIEKDAANIRSLTNLSKILHEDSRSEEAFKLLNPCYLSPENVERLCLLSEEGITLKEYDRASRHLRMALPNFGESASLHDQPLNARLASALNTIGITYVRNGKVDEAVEQYIAACSFAPDDATRSKIEFNLGMAYMRGQQYEKAKEWFERANEKATGNFIKPATYMAKAQSLANTIPMLERRPDELKSIVNDDEPEMIMKRSA